MPSGVIGVDCVSALKRDSRAPDNRRAQLAAFKSSLDITAFALAAILAFVIAGCSTNNVTPSYPGAPQSYYQRPPTSAHPHQRTEVASWYGPGLVGRRTSTGERFDPNALTAASKTLPLGSHVKVTNPRTGKSVVVRINDRGPHVRGRSLDLSPRAAQELGFTNKGVARVHVASLTGNNDLGFERAPEARRDTPDRRRRVPYARSTGVVRRDPESGRVVHAEEIE